MADDLLDLTASNLASLHDKFAEEVAELRAALSDNDTAADVAVRRELEDAIGQSEGLLSELSEAKRVHSDVLRTGRRYTDAEVAAFEYFGFRVTQPESMPRSEASRERSESSGYVLPDAGTGFRLPVRAESVAASDTGALETETDIADQLMYVQRALTPDNDSERGSTGPPLNPAPQPRVESKTAATPPSVFVDPTPPAVLPVATEELRYEPPPSAPVAAAVALSDHGECRDTEDRLESRIAELERVLDEQATQHSGDRSALDAMRSQHTKDLRAVEGRCAAAEEQLDALREASARDADTTRLESTRLTERLRAAEDRARGAEEEARAAAAEVTRLRATASDALQLVEDKDTRIAELERAVREAQDDTVRRGEENAYLRGMLEYSRQVEHANQQLQHENKELRQALDRDVRHLTGKVDGIAAQIVNAGPAPLHTSIPNDTPLWQWVHGQRIQPPTAAPVAPSVSVAPVVEPSPPQPEPQRTPEPPVVKEMTAVEVKRLKEEQSALRRELAEQKAMLQRRSTPVKARGDQRSEEEIELLKRIALAKQLRESKKL